MKTKKLKEIIRIFEESNLKSLEIKNIFQSIKLERQGVVSESFAPFIQAPPSVPAIKAEKEKDVIDFNDLTEIKSPMVGIFYGASSPDAQAFVKKGSKVKKGDVICIIEAMKVMNEITSDYDGEIVDILAENGKLVEFSQVMFRLKQK